MLYAEIANLLKLIFGIHLAYWIVCRLLLDSVFRGKKNGRSLLRGVLRTIILVLGVTARSSSSKSIVQLAADEVVVAPSPGGCIGTKTILPPGISILLMYLLWCEPCTLYGGNDTLYTY